MWQERLIKMIGRDEEHVRKNEWMRKEDWRKIERKKMNEMGRPTIGRTKATIKEGLIQKRKGKGCRCCWGNRIDSIPCLTTDILYSARMIWRNGLIEIRTLGGMDASEQLDDLPVHTTPNHNPPKKDVLPNFFFFKSSLLING